MRDDTASNPSKKRKANNGRATMAAGGGLLSSLFGYYFSPPTHDTSTGHDGNNTNNDRFMQQTLSHMERMEQSMLRMEEKLSSMSSVERRCEELEAKCSSLETNLAEKVNTLELKLDSALELLKQNKNWTYPVAIDSYDWLDDEDEAAFLVNTATAIKEKTIKMRAGVFPDFDEDDDVKAIVLVADENYERYCSNKLLPHWVEFATALKQFTPATTDNNNSCFKFGEFQLERPILELIKEALIGKTFVKMSFSHNLEVDYEEGGLSMDAILEIVESNKHLRKLMIDFNDIGGDHVEKLCSIVQNHPLVQLELAQSCRESDIGNSMLTSLLSCGGLNLEVLVMNHNKITSDVSTVLVEYLAANPKLDTLDLRGNLLNNSDATLIASALCSNTTLQQLYLSENNITDDGMVEAFRPLLFDESSLNAMADSNHICYLYRLGFKSQFNLNRMVERYKNRGRKIYSLLSYRNRRVSNTQYFDDIDVEILPHMLESVQRYAIITEESKELVENDEYNHDLTVCSLSIVYEVMRKWEKVFSLYE